MRYDAAGAMLGLMLLVSPSVVVSRNVEDHQGNTNVTTIDTGLSDRPPSLVPSLPNQNRNLEVTRGEWLQMGEDLVGHSEYEDFGESVAMSRDGNRVAIGAFRPDTGEYGYGEFVVRLFEWDNESSSWKQMGEDLFHEVMDVKVGFVSLSFSGDGMRLATGVRFVDDFRTGEVRVYQWGGSAWTPLGFINSRVTFEDFFGASVSMSEDGNLVVVGAPRTSGRVEVFEWSGVEWIRQEPFFDTSFDQFGARLSVMSSENRVAITDNWFNPDTEDSGRVRVFDWKDSRWQQVGNDIVGDLPDKVESSLGLGVAMSRNGNRVAAGLTKSDVRNVDRTGFVRVYELRGSSWVQMGNDLVFDPIARSMSLSDDGRRLLIGDRSLGTGEAHILEWNGGTWELMIKLEGRLEEDDFGGYGGAVSMSGAGDRVVVGAPDGEPENCVETGDNGDCRNGYVQAFQFNQTTGPFPDSFFEVTCVYASCLAELLELFNRRWMHVTLETPEQIRHANKVRSKLNKAMRFINNDGQILRSLDKLQNAMKFVENLKDKMPLFNVGYSGSTCAAQFVRDTLRAFNSEDNPSADFLDRLRKNQLTTARRLRSEKKWKASVDKSEGAMWIVTNELGEKNVPVCLN